MWHPVSTHTQQLVKQYARQTKAMPAGVSHEERHFPNISAFFAENILATSAIEKRQFNVLAKLWDY